MTVKYYGNNYNGEAIIFSFTHINPHKNVPKSPSYCIWIVPGTVDCDGNSLI